MKCVLIIFKKLITVVLHNSNNFPEFQNIII